MRSQPTFLNAIRVLGLITVLGLHATSTPAQTWCGNPVPPCNPNDSKSPCYQPPSPDPRCEPEVCGKCQKSPCFVATGVYSISESDLSIPTAGFPLEVSRSYSSANLIDGPLGHGWTSNLTARLHDTVYLLAAPDTVEADVVIIMPDGARYRFLEQADGTFTPPAGRFDLLVANPDGSFDLTLQRTRSVMHFSADGTLASIADDYGNTLANTYDGNGRLQRVADMAGSGRYLDVYWGADGRISSVVDHTGRVIGYQYWPDGLLHTVTDPLGRVRTYEATAGKYVSLLSEIRDNWDRVITTITYDAQDRVQSYTDQGEIWTYAYNFQNDPAKTRKSDSRGNSWVFVHGAGGLVSDSIPPANSGGASTQSTYDSDGLVQLAVDEVGVKTLFTYDSEGRTESITHDYQGSSSVRFDYVYDPSFPSQVVAVVPQDPTDGSLDPNWQGWRYEYYPTGSHVPGALRHIFRVRADGSTLDLLESREYDDQGRITAIERPNGHRSEYVYDGYVRTVVRSPSNDDSGSRPEKEYEYDSLGRIVAVWDPLQNLTVYTYDAIGRTTGVTLPAPEQGSPLIFATSIAYDIFDSQSGLTYTVVTDPAGNVSRIGYDQFGRVVESQDAQMNRMTYTYTAGLLTSVTDPNGYATTYEYDALRRLNVTTFPDDTEETLSYWPDGLLKTRVDRKGGILTFEYEALKRLKRKVYSDGTSISYTFEGQKLNQVNDTHVDPDETHTLSYDDSFRLQLNTQANRGAVSYAYDSSDRMTSLAIAGGPTAVYDYYPDGSLSTIGWSEVSGQFKYVYNLRGQEEAVTFPSGQQRIHEYDLQGRLRRLVTQHPVTGLLASFDYGYDFDWDAGTATKLGLRTSVVETAPQLSLVNAETKYRYDNGKQLIGADYPPQAPYDGEIHRWSYDAIGNRLATTIDGQSQAYSYQRLGSSQENWQRLISDGTTSYTFDLNGNVATMVGPGASMTLTWDSDDRLRAINDGTPTSFQYDYEGRRVRRSGVEEISYLYDRHNRIALLGQQSVYYLFGQTVDEVLAVARDGEVEFAVVDGLGSIHGLADGQGQLTEGRVLDAWGEVILGGATSDDPVFTGREVLAPGLYDYRARILAPTIGRFISEDPIGFAAGPSLYRYVSNVPTQAVDPSGLVEGCKPVSGWIGMPPIEWVLKRSCNVWGFIGKQDIGLRPKVACVCTWGLRGELKWYDLYENQSRELACYPCFRELEFRRVAIELAVKRYEPYYTLDGKVPKTHTAGVYICGPSGCSCHCRNPNECLGDLPGNETGMPPRL